MDVRIFYEDTDCGGMVYYANYLKYFERIRTLYLEHSGISLSDWLEQGIHFVVTEVSVKYKSFAKLDDVLRVSVSIAGVAGATFSQNYRIVEKTRGRLVVTGESTICLIGADGRPTRIPESLRQRIEENPEYS